MTAAVQKDRAATIRMLRRWEAKWIFNYDRLTGRHGWQGCWLAGGGGLRNGDPVCDQRDEPATDNYAERKSHGATLEVKQPLKLSSAFTHRCCRKSVLEYDW
jgi:hypothetical protein